MPNIFGLPTVWDSMLPVDEFGDELPRFDAHEDTGLYVVVSCCKCWETAKGNTKGEALESIVHDVECTNLLEWAAELATAKEAAHG